MWRRLADVGTVDWSRPWRRPSTSQVDRRRAPLAGAGTRCSRTTGSTGHSSGRMTPPCRNSYQRKTYTTNFGLGRGLQGDGLGLNVSVDYWV